MNGSFIWLTKVIIPARLAVCLFTFCCTATGLAAGANRPNILFIMSDDLGYRELGSYGQKLIQTPHLDQMASDGIRFTSFYSGSTVCAPSRATLLTGHHTGHNFIRGNGNPPLPTEPATLSMLIKQAGYKTGIIGKWGMGGVGTPGAPSAQGFDEFIGFLGHKHAHDQYPDHLFRGDDRIELPEGTYANDLFTSEAVEFVRRHKSEPFFLFLSYTIPHQKLQVPSQGAYAGKDWPAAERNKAAMISRMDAGIGQVLQELQAHGLDKNTLVLFTSDNGPHTEDGTDPEFFESNGPLRGIKRDLYEGGIRVPMIGRYPAAVPSGQTNDQPWAMWDILPTLLDFIGAPAPSGRDGVSMKAAFTDATVIDHGPLYWEFYERGFTQAVRQDQWKLVKTSTGTLELYNLAEDIGETTNLASDHPDRLMELMPLLTSMRTNSERWDLSEVNNRGKKKQQKKRQNQNRKSNLQQ